ncbi:MAG: bifunctional phosphopantothenoylcysteine decarboxylase/phosphopantothenate--cysteine ligase CoaBC [Bacteroidales bacterium]
MSLEGKKILLGIGGGIAAYKSLSLIRLLVCEKAEVRVVCTDNALNFVSPLSIETLSNYKLYCNTFEGHSSKTTSHIAYADWADLLIVAPATANLIGKFANGIADDALSTLFLAFHKKVLLAPSMNTYMYQHPAVQSNIAKLRSMGIDVLEPESGFLACGTQGCGRMPEVDSLLDSIKNALTEPTYTYFRGKKILITAGPTVEAIDPVRYISNRSSGRMGFCIAEALCEQGAEVYLISGPTHLNIEATSIHRTKVQSAAQMYEACVELWPQMDLAILTAAVADYTPLTPCKQKIKKKEESLSLTLVRTSDILATLGKSKKKHQTLVGFALETNSELENAQAKLKNKNADFIVLNSMKDAGAGFESLTNKVTFLDNNGGVFPQELKTKKEVAYDLLKFLSDARKKSIS